MLWTDNITFFVGKKTNKQKKHVYAQSLYNMF